MQTLLFFDFDGVINPIPFYQKWVGPEDDTPWEFAAMIRSNWETIELEIDPDIYFAPDNTAIITVPDNGYRKERKYIIRWSSELINRINALIAENDAQFHWLTTWRETAPILLAPVIGLDPSLPWVEWQQRMSDYEQWGKYEGLMDLYKKGETRPAVWIDDVATKSRENFTSRPREEWEDEHPTVFDEKGINNLIIKTVTEYGITREQWDAVERFVKEQQ